MKPLKLSSSFILYLVCISAFFASLNQNIYSPIIPLIRDSFHVSVSMVNLSVSLFIFITAVMQIILGSIVDFKGARFVMMASIVITVIASIGCAAAQDFTLFLIFRVLQAVGTAALPLIAATTIGGLFEGTKRGSAMGTYQMLLSVAPAAAPILGGFIGERYNYPGIFWFLTGLSVILLLANAFYFPREDTGKKANMTANKLMSHYTDIFKNRTGNAILILSFLIFFIYFSIIVYLPILLTDSYHLDLKIVGLLYLPIAVSTIAGSMLFKWIQKKVSLGRLFLYGNLTAAGSIVFFGFTHSFSLVFMSAALVLFGITMGLIPPLFSTMMTNEFEDNRGSALGMFNFIRYTGMACGPILSGFLLERLSSVSVFGWFGIAYAAASLLLLIAGLKTNHSTSQKQKAARS
ncbi:MFS transporter [Bacillus swezeyi]|uniref:MFS transporter n=1 Tax=Bacillus swezeyi TaxID=1925020 RepID=A0A1R1S035_9BACI|nr:MFS transporter [Bacillus swezeyi]MEC1259601.1 MFS transporter [Bacillus swezeyi]MED2927436.1 MFS transporter [Bacillus swezeyi]MED2941688.1 MFS transporter [Bacillus swezeyi]MED2962634.1 MFS transporter [Bacillus swezeyi]MED2977236.1 MFS transporter [Bacillus swezeyi]